MIGTRTGLPDSGKISRTAVFDKSGDNLKQRQKKPPRGAAFCLSLPVPFGGRAAAQGRRKSVPWDFPFSEAGNRCAGLFAKGVFARKTVAERARGISPPRPLFGGSTRSFTVQKCPHADRRIRPSASSDKTGKIIARKIAIASAKCRTDGARRGKNISGPQSRSPLRRRQWIPRGQCVGGRLQGADR